MDWDKFSELYRWELDFAASSQNQDKKFWYELAIEQGCPILEIAAGDGRITEELLKTGCDVTAIDISKKMIKKLTDFGNDRLTAYVADMKNFKLDKKFALIVVGYFSFQLLLDLDEQINFLKNMKSMLNENGILGLDIYPCVCEGEDKTVLKQVYTKTFQDKTVRMFSSYKIDRLNLVKHWHDYYEIFNRYGELENSFDNNISLKECSPDYMRLLIEKSGLQIDKVYGSFSKEVVSSDSENIIYLLK